MLTINLFVFVIFCPNVFCHEMYKEQPSGYAVWMCDWVRQNVKQTRAYKFAKQFNTDAYAVYFVLTVLKRRLLTAAGTNWNFESAPTAKMFNSKFTCRLKKFNVNHITFVVTFTTNAFVNVIIIVVVCRRVRTSVYGWHDFPRFTPDLWLICDRFVNKVSDMGQPTRPTQLSIPSGSLNEY